MTLSDGFHDVPTGHLAMVVTHLQMFQPPAPRPAPDLPDITLVQHSNADPSWYRQLFRKIGENYLWFSRLELTDADLSAILSDPSYRLFTLQKDGVDLALLELDFRVEQECELAFFGLEDRLIGTGAGRFLMSQAIRLAFERPITRFHVHTCTLDSRQALGFYTRSGFTPYRRQVEIAPDPRLSGGLPKTCAPQVPLLG